MRNQYKSKQIFQLLQTHFDMVKTLIKTSKSNPIYNRNLSKNIVST